MLVVLIASLSSGPGASPPSAACMKGSFLLARYRATRLANQSEIHNMYVLYLEYIQAADCCARNEYIPVVECSNPTRGVEHLRKPCQQGPVRRAQICALARGDWATMIG